LSAGPSADRSEWDVNVVAPDEGGAEMAQTVTDPVCGMQIRPEDAVATEEHDGRTFYFCSEACHQTFVGDPHRYGHPSEG
jgi:YHS domain-containing protein